jgi:hypothetical protein
MSSADAIAEGFGKFKPWQVLIGTFVDQSGPDGVVDVGGARITMPSLGTYFPLPNDPVRVLRTDTSTFLLGPASPRSAVGKVTATGSPRITVEYPPDSGVEKLMGYPSTATPAVDDLVIIDWASGGTVTAVVTTTPDFQPTAQAPTAPSGGRRTLVFTALDSGNWNGGWWTNEVWASDNNHGAWWYGSKIRDTIPDSASIVSVEIFLPAYYQFGSDPNFRLHADNSKPGGAPSYTGAVMPLTGARSGWVGVPTTVGDYLKANVGGTGFRQGGFTKYRGTQADGQSGALRITFDS